MDIGVDRTKCQGHGRCVVIAPDVFALDDEGISYVPVAPPKGHYESAVKATQACPEQAITITDEMEH